MSLFDDIYSKAKAGIEGATVDDIGNVINGGINAYIRIQQANAQKLVRVGALPTGNLTPEQIAAGMVPITQPVAAPASGFVNAVKSAGSTLPIIAAVGVGAYFLMKKMKK